MIGYCGWTREKRDAGPERFTLCGLPLYGGWVREDRRGARRVARMAQKLARAGVRRALTPADFPYMGLLETRGLSRPELAPLLRGLAPRLALAWLEQRGMTPERATVALRGDRSAQLWPAAEALCPRVGGLVLQAPDSGRLASRLRREYGLAAVEGSCAAAPDLTLAFAPGERESGPVLPLWTQEIPAWGLTLTLPGLPGPEVCEPLSLLAALWETGRLDPALVQIDFS